jgi:hypothetical protein
MAIPSYAYLKLKIPGPTDVITVEAKTQRVFDYEQNNIELAAAAVVVAELRELCPPHLVPSRWPRMPRPYESTPRTRPKPFKLGPT